MNIAILKGRLTADPEIRQTQGGTSVASFTTAVTRDYKNKETGEYDADFLRCKAFGATADFLGKYFSKGQEIAVTGRLSTGSYTDKNHSDVTHYTTDIVVNKVEFCGSKSDNQSVGTANGSYQTQQRAAQTPPAQARQDAQNAALEGDLSDFEEILSDGEVPF